MQFTMPHRHNLPRQDFPLTIEAVHPVTRAVVWRNVVPMPGPGGSITLSLPPVGAIVGHFVVVRIRTASGYIWDGTSGASEN